MTTRATRTSRTLAQEDGNPAESRLPALLQFGAGILASVAMALPAQARNVDLSAALALVASTESAVQFSELRKAGELTAPLAVVAAPENALALLTIRAGNSAPTAVAQQTLPPLAQAVVARVR